MVNPGMRTRERSGGARVTDEERRRPTGRLRRRRRCLFVGAVDGLRRGMNILCAFCR
jgi:hypothetical protein